MPSVKVIAQGMCHGSNHNITLMPSVKVTAQGMCHGSNHNITLMPSIKVTAQGMCHGSNHTPGLTFWHLPPNSARISHATEGALFTSPQLSIDNSAPSEILGPNKTLKAPQRRSTRINMRQVHPVNRAV